MHSHGYRDRYADFAAKNIAVFGLNDGDAEKTRDWVERESLPFPILLDPGRTVALAYGVAQPGAERYVANNAEGRRPAVIIDEDGNVLRSLPDLATVEGQAEELAHLT